MSGDPKPYAEACDQNRQPILEVIARVYTEPGTLLEIGSGTGQHAVFFARHLPHLQWQPTDVAANLPGIGAWIEEAGLPNVRPPLALDVRDWPWAMEGADAAFSANAAHIMSWPAVEALFAGIGQVLVPGAPFCLYGPFNIGGDYTAESNARFDAWLRSRDPNMGVRDVEALEALAQAAGLELTARYAMPADNFTLVFHKS